jgi:Fe2+ or Zn2+ uptake regulation protein
MALQHAPPTRRLTAFLATRRVPVVTAPQANRDKFRSILAARGLRLTNQRIAILDAATAQPEHFTESGLLREVDLGTGNKFYVANRDTAPTQHAQVLCLDCDKIFEIGAPFMEWYGTSVCDKLGLQPVSQRLQVHARCTTFQKTGTCKHRAV